MPPADDPPMAVSCDTDTRAAGSAELVPRLSAGRQRTFDRRWAFFLIDDLNGLADQWRLALGLRDESQIAGILARLRRLLSSLGWNAELALPAAYRFAREKVVYPEDAWGPALIIGSLDPDGERFSLWLQSLRPDVRRALEDVPSLVDRLASQGRGTVDL
jgi:hypothetical protein